MAFEIGSQMPDITAPALSPYVLAGLALLAINALTVTLLATHPQTRAQSNSRAEAPGFLQPVARAAKLLAGSVCPHHLLWLAIGATAIAVWCVLTVPVHLLPVAMLLGAILVALAVFDSAAFILPNPLCLLLAVAGLAIAALSPSGDLASQIAAMLVGGGSLYAINSGYRWFRGRDGLGMGDVKLLAAAGAWLPLSSLPSSLLIGASAAAIYGGILAVWSGRRLAEERVPFGAFLCLGIWLTWLYGPIVLS